MNADLEKALKVFGQQILTTYSMIGYEGISFVPGRKYVKICNASAARATNKKRTIYDFLLTTNPRWGIF